MRPRSHKLGLSFSFKNWRFKATIHRVARTTIDVHQGSQIRQILRIVCKACRRTLYTKGLCLDDQYPIFQYSRSRFSFSANCPKHTILHFLYLQLAVSCKLIRVLAVSGKWCPICRKRKKACWDPDLCWFT
jgi:hypothetical protein